MVDQAGRDGRARAVPARRPRRRRRRRAQLRDGALPPVRPRVPGAMDRERLRPHRQLDAAGGVLPRPDAAALVDPVDLARARLLSAGFGNRIDPFTGQRDFHPGIDISTPIGTQVQAPADGIVRLLRADKGGYGNAIIIDHGYGIVTPLRPPRRASTSGPGQRVRRGDVIGFVGNTGRSTGAPPPLRGLGARPGPEPDPLHPRRVPQLRLARAVDRAPYGPRRPLSLSRDASSALGLTAPSAACYPADHRGPCLAGRGASFGLRRSRSLHPC